MWGSGHRGLDHWKHHKTIKCGYLPDNRSFISTDIVSLPLDIRGEASRLDSSRSRARDTAQRTTHSATFAPSWSWASVDGPVVWIHESQSGNTSLLTNIRLDPELNKSFYSSTARSITFQAQAQSLEYKTTAGFFMVSGEDGQLEHIEE